MLSRWHRYRHARNKTSTPKPEARPGGPERLLPEEDYFSFVFFGLCGLVIKTMRGLCLASYLKRVQDEVITLLAPRKTEA